VRAFRTLGWQKVDTLHEARVIHTAAAEQWYATADEDANAEIKSWQRYNHISNSSAWGRRENMLQGFARYRQGQGHRELYFLPDTYRLHVSSEFQTFSDQLPNKGGGGRKDAWTLTMEGKNQGKQIILFPPNSKDMKVELQQIPAINTRYYMQKTVCQQLTWRDGSNLMIRVFWLVSIFVVALFRVEAL
jgi:hypothetical protein